MLLKTEVTCITAGQASAVLGAWAQKDRRVRTLLDMKMEEEGLDALVLDADFQEMRARLNFYKQPSLSAEKIEDLCLAFIKTLDSSQFDPEKNRKDPDWHKCPAVKVEAYLKKRIGAMLSL